MWRILKGKLREKYMFQFAFHSRATLTILIIVFSVIDANNKTQYASVDELLIDIGKSHKRDYLLSVLSKLLKVPLSMIREADTANPITTFDDEYLSANKDKYQNDSDYLAGVDLIEDGEDEIVQFIEHDTDELCTTCLPVLGDDIIGTIDVDGTVTIHRKACSVANQIIFANDENGRNDSIQLNWPTINEQHDTETSVDLLQYPVEVSVIANDRKLLLADCSEIVSEYSDIMKTGSQTISKSNVEIVARLDFLVKVADLPQLQQLMDKLRDVENVMSVERRFGSTLL